VSLEIRIIGKGCFFCDQLHKIVEELLAEMKVSDATVEQVHEMDALLDYGVVNPPALVINGKLKMMGRVLVRGRVRQAIAEELERASPAGERRGAESPTLHSYGDGVTPPSRGAGGGLT